MRKSELAPVDLLKQRDLLTVREACVVFGYSSAFIYQKINEGALRLIAGRLSQSAFKDAWELGFPINSHNLGKQEIVG